MSYQILLQGRTLQVILQDAIDLSVTAALKQEFEQVMSSDVTCVNINAASLAYIDSSGVASLLFMRKLCTRFGAGLVFDSVSDSAARVIQLANLDGVLGLPKATSSVAQTGLQQNMAARMVEPKFSDADALAIFQNDSPAALPMAISKVAEAGTFEIKPPSFS
jgi:anti-anti-sigma factor